LRSFESGPACRSRRETVAGVEGATPADDALPFNSPTAVTLAVGEQATVMFEPEKRVTDFVLPIMAISKHSDATYTVRTDDETVYGPAPVPPTDPDDLQQTFYPPQRFSQSLTVEVANVGGASATYVIQPVGWEVTE